MPITEGNIDDATRESGRDGFDGDSLGRGIAPRHHAPGTFECQNHSVIGGHRHNPSGGGWAYECSCSTPTNCCIVEPHRIGALVASMESAYHGQTRSGRMCDGNKTEQDAYHDSQGEHCFVHENRPFMVEITLIYRHTYMCKIIPWNE